MRHPLIAGNWKMHGLRAHAQRLAAEVASGVPAPQAVEVAICPPFVHLADAAASLAGSAVALGAQNVAPEAEGAHTGEVSAAMLADVGCRFVIVGHSERRQHYGDDDALVARRFRQAREAGLVPILCVGETLAEREADATATVVARQVDAVFAAVGANGFGDAVIAYEPVWAIGTGRTATPEQAQTVHAALRDRLAGHLGEAAAGVRLLYGGSMKPDNAAALLSMPDVDGGLIGGASLKAEDFLAICRAAAER
ncbi:triose-phosphate isomerase [Sediminicurvatus halobius]|uniref:Triosephosphate isomerase n=1 Tax=Sediminicurvatus halobius TaxID=2182432 RepID=A0A2U2N4C9_9GAMM|nr:triose-phosphate isomerase [Spiribacter halobius]PWG64081.1 triose-phosphate isomerase [Spiribacter halobius]UEX76865.1 triose-phosphate isomerase [Spiribacter halobius]